MSVWWFVAAVTALVLWGRYRTRRIARRARRKALEDLEQHRVKTEVMAAFDRRNETLWPGSNANRWPPADELPRHPAAIAAGIARAELYANTPDE